MMISTKRRYMIGIIGVVMLGIFSGCGKEESVKKQQAGKATAAATIKELSLPEESYGTIADGVYTATGGALQMTVPDDWSVSKENATVLIAGEEGKTKDCVSVQCGQKDENFSNYKKKDFEEYFSSIFDNCNVRKFSHTTVAGLPAIYIEYVCSKDDSDVVGYEYMVDGNYTYTISFTDVSGELKKEVDSVVESVVFCK